MNKKIEYFISNSNIDVQNYILHYNFNSENVLDKNIKNIGYYNNLSGALNTGILNQSQFSEIFNKLPGYVFINGEDLKNISLPNVFNVNLNKIVAGKNFSVALRDDKKIISWGEQLNEFTDFLELNQFWGQTVSGNKLENIKDISVNSVGLYVLALLDNGRVTGWGKNDYNVATGGNDIISATKISAGFNHGLALLPNGTITGWRNNSYGQIYNLNLVTNATGVFAGSGYSLILKQNGTITGFGLDNWGQISSCNSLTNVKS